MLLNCDNPTTPSEEIITWISLSLHAPNGQQPCLTKVWLVVGDVFYSPLNLLTMNPIHYVQIYNIYICIDICIYIYVYIIYIYIYLYIYTHSNPQKDSKTISVSVGFYFSISLFQGLRHPAVVAPVGAMAGKLAHRVRCSGEDHGRLTHRCFGVYIYTVSIYYIC